MPTRQSSRTFLVHSGDPVIALAIIVDDSLPQKARSACERWLSTGISQPYQYGNRKPYTTTLRTTLNKEISQHPQVAEMMARWFVKSDDDSAVRSVSGLGKSRQTVQFLLKRIEEAKTLREVEQATYIAATWSNELTSHEAQELWLATAALPVEYFEVDRLLDGSTLGTTASTELAEKLFANAPTDKSAYARGITFLKQLEAFEKRCRESTVDFKMSRSYGRYANAMASMMSGGMSSPAAGGGSMTGFGSPGAGGGSSKSRTKNTERQIRFSTAIARALRAIDTTDLAETDRKFMMALRKQIEASELLDSSSKQGLLVFVDQLLNPPTDEAVR